MVMVPVLYAVKAVVLFGTLLLAVPGVSSQEEGDGGQNQLSRDAVCRAPKPSVGPSSREYIVGCNTFHRGIMNYLTELVGPEFDPPISFKRHTGNDYLKKPTVKESLAIGYDFMVNHPYATSCYESEGQVVSLATQLHRSDASATTEEGYFNLTQYGATLYTLKNRTDIQTVTDVKGKRVGSNKITNLATHLCYDVLLRSGVHHLQDPKQTIFFKNSNQALKALLAQDVDVACAATGTLENYVNPATGERLDLSNIRILHAQSHVMSNGMPFPLAVSSHLVPGYQFVAFPHVEAAVQIRVQKELLAMRDHADVAPALLACLEEAQCFVNNTACLETCFASLDSGTIRNCDTTPQLALKAFDALKNSSGKAMGFTKPLQNLLLRDIQETTGFLVKDPASSSATMRRCVRMKKIADAVTCPEGHFALSSQEILQQCNVSGLPCFERDCICRPCVKAYEVDFFASALVRTPNNSSNQEGEEQQSSSSSAGSLGSGCSKFSICGTVEQEHVLSFRAIDNKGRPNAKMAGALLREDESEEPFAFEQVADGTFQYNFTASRRAVGQQVLKIRIDNEEIPESPFRINIVPRDCVADTGDERREADALGHCVCERWTVELLSDKCVPLATLVPSISIPLVVFISILLCVCLSGKRKKEDSVWMVRKEEISFATPPKVLGSGAFGVVLLGEFRGTQVAVKRVLPPRGMAFTENDDFSNDDNDGDVEQGGADSPKAAMPQSDLANTKGYTDKRGRGATAESSPAPNKPTAPVRDGVAELAARMSAAGLICRSRSGDAMRYSEVKKLKKAFIDEMRVLSRLRHPNVTTLMGAVLDDVDGPLLIMEYMDRGSLHCILHDDTVVLEAESVHSILQDIAQGMRFLHAPDPPVIHGDLKARNILVDSRFRAKVADFGLSHSKQGVKRVVGSPFWMAPELLRGESANTTASDMYSFGIILYEVFSRKQPYENEDPAMVLEEVADPSVNRRPPIPSTCPSQMKSLMEDCFAGKADQRPTFEEVDLRLKRVEVKAKDCPSDCGRSSTVSVAAGSQSGKGNDASDSRNPPARDGTTGSSGPADYFFSSLVYRHRNRNPPYGQ